MEPRGDGRGGLGGGGGGGGGTPPIQSGNPQIITQCLAKCQKTIQIMMQITRVCTKAKAKAEENRERQTFQNQCIPQNPLRLQTRDRGTPHGESNACNVRHIQCFMTPLLHAERAGIGYVTHARMSMKIDACTHIHLPGQTSRRSNQPRRHMRHGIQVQGRKTNPETAGAAGGQQIKPDRK